MHATATSLPPEGGSNIHRRENPPPHHRSDASLSYAAFPHAGRPMGTGMRWGILLGCFMAAPILGCMDVVTGVELGFFVFYFPPIILLAWIAGVRKAYALSVFSLIVWIVADYAEGHRYSHLMYAYWDSAIRLTSFLSIAYWTSKIRKLMDLRQNLTRQIEEARDHLEEKVAERTRELNLAFSRLAMQEKMASVGRLAAGLAHEINNPVSFVITNFDTLRDDVRIFADILVLYRELLSRLHAEGRIEREFDVIRRREQAVCLDAVLGHLDALVRESKEGLKRVSDIIAGMRDFSYAYDPGKWIPHDLNKGIQDALLLARNTYRYHAKIETDFGALPPVTCIPDQINRVFLNLIVNAAQAIASNAPENQLGLIRVSTRADAHHAYVEIADSGPGVPPEIQEHIFDPFFTTKEPGQGMGLGLSISYDIVVNRHGGSLSVTREPGQGARFIVRLPLRQPGDSGQDTETVTDPAAPAPVFPQPPHQEGYPS